MCHKAYELEAQVSDDQARTTSEAAHVAFSIVAVDRGVQLDVDRIRNVDVKPEGVTGQWQAGGSTSNQGSTYFVDPLLPTVSDDAMAVYICKADAPARILA